MTIFGEKGTDGPKIVSVFCSSSDKIDPAYRKAAKRMGEILAKNKIKIVNTRDK